MFPTRAEGLPVLVVLLLLAMPVGFSFWGFSYDDAFITYRYADNVASGEGLTYNPGERVLGTTAPGYAALLAAVSYLTRWVGIGIPEWGSLLSIGALLVTCLLPAWSTSPKPTRGGLELALMGGFLVLFLPWNIEVLGAETLPTMALVAAASVLALGYRRQFAAGLLLSFAMWLRLDSCLAVPGICGLAWWRERRFPFTFVGSASVPVALGLAWLHLKFGGFLPDSLAGKQAEYVGQDASYTLAQWAWLQRTLPPAAWVALLALAIVGLCALVRNSTWRNPTLLALASWLVSHETFYRAVKVHFAPWYHVSLVNAIALLAVHGALVLARSPFEGLNLGRNAAMAVKRDLSAAGALLLLAPILFPSLQFVRGHWRRPPDPRFEVYRDVGNFLAAEPGNGLVAAVEIGIIGYYSRKPILDFVGLVSPRVLEERSQGRLQQLMAELQPRYIVDAPLFRADYPVLHQYGSTDSYEPIATFEDPASGRGRIRVLRRVGAD